MKSAALFTRCAKNATSILVTNEDGGHKLMSDKFYLIDEQGNELPVDYEDIDEEILPHLLQPIGGFIFPGEAFTKLRLTKAPFYVEDWLPKHGKMMIYGGAKAGKSTLAIQMARAIAQDEPFLGKKTTHGKVLYIQFELGVEVLQGRLLKTGQDYEGVFFGTTFHMKLDKPEGRAMLERALEAVEPQVLILDPWVKVISGDENASVDMLPILDYLDSLIDAYEDSGLSIAIMNHMGKDPRQGARGTSVYEGWVDSYIELRRVSPPNDPVLRSRLTPKLLRHAAMPPHSIDLVLGDNLEFQVGEQALTVKDKLILFGQGKKMFKMQEAIDAGIGSRKSIYSARIALLKANKLKDFGDGNYSII